MTRERCIAIAKAAGWVQWGKLRRYGGSSYQCFRFGKHYAWIGLTYAEVTYYGVAVDFSRSSESLIAELFDPTGSGTPPTVSGVP